MTFLAATALLVLLGADCSIAASLEGWKPSNGTKFVVQLFKKEAEPGLRRWGDSSKVSYLLWDQSGYCGYIDVGYPPQRFLVDFDTGSSLLWIVSDRLPFICDNGNNNINRCYNEDRAITSYGKQIPLGYGTGAGMAHLVEDFVSVAGLPPTIQRFGAAYELDKEFMKIMGGRLMRGILGLGLNVENSFINWLNHSSLLQRNIFSIKLTNERASSEIMFGGWDDNIVEDEINWIPIRPNPTGYWQFEVTRMTIGGDEVVGPSIMMADTGCTLNVLSPNRFRQVARFLGAYYDEDVMVIYDPSRLSDISFLINGREYVLTPADYMGVDRYGRTTVGFQRQNNWSEGQPEVLLGDVFLRKYYSIHDFGNLQIAFVPYASGIY